MYAEKSEHPDHLPLLFFVEELLVLLLVLTERRVPELDDDFFLSSSSSSFFLTSTFLAGVCFRDSLLLLGALFTLRGSLLVSRLIFVLGVFAPGRLTLPAGDCLTCRPLWPEILERALTDGLSLSRRIFVALRDSTRVGELLYTRVPPVEVRVRTDGVEASLRVLVVVVVAVLPDHTRLSAGDGRA